MDVKLDANIEQLLKKYVEETNEHLEVKHTIESAVNGLLALSLVQKYPII